ncbi:glycosyl hydrolase family 76-domain-containing protein [Dipodascopsis uninucleata]
MKNIVTMTNDFAFMSLVLAIIGSINLCYASGITLDISSDDSIKSACTTIASGLMNYYHGNEAGYIPGIFSGNYYWWESGAAWGSMIDYWYYTGDDTWVDDMVNGLIFQVGSDWDFMPANETSSLGNDDQAFWGIAAMAAAERNFTNPSSDDPQWLALAQAVFNSIALVWDSATCDGGVRWQKFVFNSGYDYKNTISNGLLLQLGARLARYTANDTYAQWAEKVWDWETEVGFIDSSTYAVYDGASIDEQCTKLNKIQWTYNFAVHLAGCAYMYDYTNQSSTWKTRLDGLISSLEVFLYQDTNIVYEPACEPSSTSGSTNCNIDQQSFKAYFGRFLGLTMQVAPYTKATLLPILQASSAAAVSTCNGGSDGVTCGFSWLVGTYDGNYGLGEQMAALEVTQNLLSVSADAPYTASSGGSSKGDPSLGTGAKISYKASNIATKDRVGAWIITFLISASMTLLCIWSLLEPKFEGTSNLKEWIRLDDLS